MDQADIDNRFSFHPADSPERREAHEAIREVMREAAEYVGDYVPTGREQALSVTKLEEAMYWANAAIARKLTKASVLMAAPKPVDSPIELAIGALENAYLYLDGFDKQEANEQLRKKFPMPLTILVKEALDRLIDYANAPANATTNESTSEPTQYKGFRVITHTGSYEFPGATSAKVTEANYNKTLDVYAGEMLLAHFHSFNSYMRMQ